MPIYEFECRGCGRRTSALVLSRARVSEVRCRKCGGADLERLYSRFATPRSEQARLSSMADPSSLGDLDESDPASMARFMKKMGREMGEDLGPDFDQALEEGMADETAPGDGGDEGGGDSSSGAP